MATVSGYECQYFYEDEVYCYKEKTGTVQYGIVLENSEYASSDEDDDSENEAPKLKRGQIRVAWYPTGKENVTSENKVCLEDRSLMPGDVVACKENGREKICGYCRKVKSVATVRVLDTNVVIENVKSEDLQPLEEFSPDIAVTLNGWVGMARSVKSKIIMRTQDGSLCSMDDHEALELRNIHNKYSKDSEFHHDEFYPGQILTGKLSKFLLATWLEGGLHMPSNESTKAIAKINIVAKVERVELISLGVQWQCQSWSGNPLLNEQPKFLIEGEELKKVRMLNVFEPCTLQLGDKSFYQLKSTDKTVTTEEWHQSQKKRLFPATIKEKKRNVSNKAHTSDEWESEVSDEDHSSSRSTSQGGGRMKGGMSNFSVSLRSKNKRKLRKAKTKAESPTNPITAGDRLVVETLCTNSWIDVVWQDGTSACGVSSRDLFPVYHLDDKEFFPGDFVVQADSNCNTAILDYGVVQRVNAQARTAVIQWMKTDTKPEWNNPAVIETTEVSVYDLKDHPDFKFRPGSIVVRVAGTGESAAGAAGQVLDNHQTGKVEVWWSEGQTTLCWPQELYRIGDYDSEAGELWDDETDFDDVDDYDRENAQDDSQQSWETESETSVTGDVSFREADSPSKSRPSKTNRLAVNFEKARNALQKLCTLLDPHDQISGQFNTLQTGEVLKVLLDVYKQCRYLDRLMGSSFFHERNFEGLLEKVRQDERQDSNNRLPNHLSCLLGFSNAEDVGSSQSHCDSVPISHNASVGDADMDSEETLTRVMDAVNEICQEYGLPQMEEDPSSVVEAASDSGQLKIRQVCFRLSQLLRSQLSFSTEEMNRWCSIRSKESGEEEPVVNQDSSASASISQVAGADDDPIESTESGDVNVEETVVPLEGRGIFTIIENVPAHHKYHWSPSQPTDPKLFQKCLRKELDLLSTSLPGGIHVKTFEDRMVAPLSSLL